MNGSANYPQRIVCLTEETTETLYLLGEQDRIVGISGFTVRPPQARKEKPKVSAFTSAKINKILDLKPDLVLGFSDLQADIAADLIKSGIAVHVFNQRSIKEILGMILTLGGLLGINEKSEQLVYSLQEKINKARARADQLHTKPTVYFEEWNDPLISGIQWVSELIELAGGKDCFSELAAFGGAKDRIIRNPADVINRDPDIIIGSWCGRKFNPQHVIERPGWKNIKAVKNQQLFEIKSANILQPGPAALTDGLDTLQEIILNWSEQVC